MPKLRLEDIQKLVEEVVLPFYLTERDMAIPVGKRRNENDAEHSWSVALLACSMAPKINPKMDIGKIAQFALVHDLVEIFAGDTSVWSGDASVTSKEAREQESLEKLITTVPNLPWIGETIQAYERQDTEEARFVRSVDKIIAVYMRHLDKGIFYKEMQITKERYDRDMISHRKKAHGHADAAVYYEMMRDLADSFPEYFYQEEESIPKL